MLWSLWELLITETPLLIVGDNPEECSHAVMVLLSLISPLKSQADYRPYITIYENDIKEFVGQSRQKKFGNLLLGVSNPYFGKMLENVPAVYHLDRGYFIERKLNCPKDLELSKKELGKVPKEAKASLVTQRKLHVPPCKQALKHLNMDKSVEEALAINNWILRKHFKEMTESFLSAFNDYVRVDYAVKGSGDPHQMKFNLTKPFKSKEFLEGLGKKDNHFCKHYMHSREKSAKLYREFIDTTLFRKYLTEKKKEVHYNKSC